MKNYIKLSGIRRDTGAEDLFQGKRSQRSRIEEHFFFDDGDPAEVSGAFQRAQGFRDRHPGISLQISIWRNIDAASVKQIGVDRSEREPNWWQGVA